MEMIIMIESVHVAQLTYPDDNNKLKGKLTHNQQKNLHHHQYEKKHAMLVV